MKHQLAPGAPGCHFRMWRQAAIDAQVVAQLRTWQVAPIALEAALDAELGQSPSPGRSTRETLEGELAALRQRIQRWYDAYEAGVIDTDALRARVDRLLQTQVALEQELSAVAVVGASLSHDQRAFLRDALLNLARTWDTLLPLERKQLLRELIAGGQIQATGRVTLTFTNQI